MSAEFHRPVKLPGSAFDYHVGGADPSDAHQVAQATAWALLHRVREGADPATVSRVLAHAANNGIDDIAEVWADSHRSSLAGILWRLYLVHTATAQNSQQHADLFQYGLSVSPSAEQVVAGLSTPITPEAMRDLCSTILRGVFSGDFAAALDRAWAYCRLISLGAAQLADQRETDSEEHARALTTKSLRYQELAADFRAAAALWRAGKLD